MFSMKFNYSQAWHPQGKIYPRISATQEKILMHTSMWSRKRRARSLVSFRKKGEPATREHRS
jgi:hypothetical protein